VRKIPTLFTFDPDTGLIRDDVNPRAELVVAGVCRPTRKYDGLSCLYYGGTLWRRRMLNVEKPEGEGRIVQILALPTAEGIGTKTESVRPLSEIPHGFMAAQDVCWNEDGTGSVPGWVPVGKNPDDQYHIEALAARPITPGEGKTYELCGPKIQGNHEYLAEHQLIEHGSYVLMNVPYDFDGILEYFEEFPITEGIVWWYDDKPYAKIKRRDYGLEWPVAK